MAWGEESSVPHSWFKKESPKIFSKHREDLYTITSKFGFTDVELALPDMWLCLLK